jgi:hypothetical protein
MKKVLIITVTTVCIFLIPFFGWHFLSSTLISDNQKLEDFISRNDQVKQVNIKATTAKDQFLVAYYSNGTSEKMIILEKDKIFPNRYKFFGGGSGPGYLNTYNYSESNSHALIIVYGNNTKLKASSYNMNHDGHTYSNKKLENYVLDVYCFDHTSNAACTGDINDRNGNIIGQFQ